MEPWDGPASIAFTDGEVIGAVLDRNGLRPSRYYVTHDDMVIMASEVWVCWTLPGKCQTQGSGSIPDVSSWWIPVRAGVIDDSELKQRYIDEQPYGRWLKENLIPLERSAQPRKYPRHRPRHLLQRQQVFGYTHEELRILVAPMASKGKSPLVPWERMQPWPCCQTGRRLYYDYFKQLFAQVTNPPLDGIREELVTQSPRP